MIVIQYIINIWLAFDKLVSAIFGGNGSETISTRLGLAMPTCKVCSGICWVLSLISKNHCQNAANPNIPSIGKVLWNWGGDATTKTENPSK